MNTHRFMVLLIVIAVFGVTACALSAESNPADRFAGTWSGSMGFSDDPGTKQDVIVDIPTGCVTDAACGETDNGTSKWEMTLTALAGDVFEYKFSQTLGDGDTCEAGVGTGGSLSLQSDGTLMREHHTPQFTASGALTRE